MEQLLKIRAILVEPILQNHSPKIPKGQFFPFFNKLILYFKISNHF